MKDDISITLVASTVLVAAEAVVAVIRGSSGGKSSHEKWRCSGEILKIAYPM